MLAVFGNGSYYTTSFELVNRYQGDVLRIEKFDPGKTFTALYYDGESKSFYVKRFSFTVSDNTPVSFISDSPKSYLVDISDDAYPRYEISWRLEDKQPETVDAADWIAKKGLGAKGKKCAAKGDVRSVRFVEPLRKPEEEEPGNEADAPYGPEGFAEQESLQDGTDSLEGAEDAEEHIEEPTLF